MSWIVSILNIRTILILLASLLLCICLVCQSTVVLSAESAVNLKAKAKRYYWGIGVDKNLSLARELYLQAAQLGDPEAQYISGSMLYKGMGGRKDYAAALKLLHSAATNGKSTPESQKIIAQAYLLGSGVPKNYKIALQWYTLAANNGDKDAQNELGFMYFVGNGIAKDTEKGAAYFLRAAYNDLTIAQYNVGIMYYTGIGVADTDFPIAYAWLNLAAAKGYQPAISARDFLETTFTEQELARSQQLSEELRKQIAR